MTSARIECMIDFRVDDSRASVVPFLERLAPIVGSPPEMAWSIDLRPCEYLGPDAAAILFALLVQARISRRPWEILLPAGPPALLGFCRFTGLTHEIDGRTLPDTDFPGNETLRLARFMTATWNLSDPLIRLVRKHIPISNEGEDHLRICVGEVLQNIDDHSESPVGGILAARYLSGLKQVRVAVVDRGHGILGTLQARYPEITSPIEALQRVVQGGFSARSLKRNAGVGLRNLATFATAQGGNLTLISGSGVLEMRPGQARPRVEQRAFDFHGTAVFFTLHVDTE